MQDSTLQTLQQLGFSLIPVKTGEKKAAEKWTRFQSEHPTAGQIKAWRTQGYVNFAVVTGRISGIVVLDIDNPEALAAVKKLGVPDNVPFVETGKGYHLYFTYPTRVAQEVGKVKTGVNVGGIKGLDIRGDGGYVLSPGSIHPSGKVYTWNDEPRLDGTSPFPEIPEWLKDILCDNINADVANQAAPIESETADVGEGGRNNFLHRVASARRARGASRREILERLISENEARCKPPLDRTELEAIADSACKYAPEIGDYQLTEIGAAQRLLDMFGDVAKFSVDHGKWILWDGQRWNVDIAETVIQYAQQVSTAFLDDADRCSNVQLAKKLRTFALGLQTHAKLTAIISIARKQSDSWVAGDQLDANPWYLNCPNGIIDLQNWNSRIDSDGHELLDAQLLPHEGKELCTRMTGVEYNANAQCPRWLAFLDEITDGDFELQSYMQRIVGYSLTGDTSEHVWFMLLGNGRNGKSTFLNALQSMLGDYSSNIRPEALLMQGMDKVPNDLAALKGARFTAASETPASRKLNESLIKQLTGGDKVQARFLFKEFFEFKPQCKLFLATNYRPTIAGTDVGIWRRTHEVPFPVSIPESEVDPDLPNKLEAELAGILAWAVRGCIEWQRNRLQPPRAVQDARQSYYREMDTVGQFIEDWCSVDPNPKLSDWRTSSKELYTAYVAWANQNNEEVLTKKAFGVKLAQRNLPPCRMHNNDRGRQGISLRAEYVPAHMGNPGYWSVTGESENQDINFMGD